MLTSIIFSSRLWKAKEKDKHRRATAVPGKSERQWSVSLWRTSNLCVFLCCTLRFSWTVLIEQGSVLHIVGDVTEQYTRYRFGLSAGFAFKCLRVVSCCHSSQLLSVSTEHVPDWEAEALIGDHMWLLPLHERTQRDVSTRPAWLRQGWRQIKRYSVLGLFSSPLQQMKACRAHCVVCLLWQPRVMETYMNVGGILQQRYLVSMQTRTYIAGIIPPSILMCTSLYNTTQTGLKNRCVSSHLCSQILQLARQEERCFWFPRGVKHETLCNSKFRILNTGAFVSSIWNEALSPICLEGRSALYWLRDTGLRTEFNQGGLNEPELLKRLKEPALRILWPTSYRCVSAQDGICSCRVEAAILGRFLSPSDEQFVRLSVMPSVLLGSVVLSVYACKGCGWGGCVWVCTSTFSDSRPERLWDGCLWMCAFSDSCTLVPFYTLVYSSEKQTCKQSGWPSGYSLLHPQCFSVHFTRCPLG